MINCHINFLLIVSEISIRSHINSSAPSGSSIWWLVNLATVRIGVLEIKIHNIVLMVKRRLDIQEFRFNWGVSVTQLQVVELEDWVGGL